MKTVGKILDKTEAVLKWICIALTASFTIIAFAQVLARYVFKHPLDWTEQTARYMFIWSVMLYMPIIMRNRSNLGFDLILKRLPLKAQKIIEILCHILITGFAACYCVYSIQFVSKTITKLVPGLGIPYWIPYSSQIAGAAFLFIFGLELAVNDIMALTSGKGDKNA